MDFTQFESVVPALGQETFFGLALGAIVIIGLIIAIVKGFALWYSARNSQKGWFWILVFVNTLGVLDLIYLIFFSKRRRK
jgi:uncharacterized membrane protein